MEMLEEKNETESPNCRRKFHAFLILPWIRICSGRMGLKETKWLAAGIHLSTERQAWNRKNIDHFRIVLLNHFKYHLKLLNEMNGVHGYYSCCMLTDGWKEEISEYYTHWRYNNRNELRWPGLGQYWTCCVLSCNVYRLDSKIKGLCY